MGLICSHQVMAEHNVHSMVFSSSCTVYGDPESLPVNETQPAGNCTNPYGHSKFMIERILMDMVTSDKVSYNGIKLIMMVSIIFRLFQCFSSDIQI